MVETSHGVGTAGRFFGILEAEVVHFLLLVSGLEAIEIQHVRGNEGRLAGLRTASQPEHLEEGGLEPPQEFMAWEGTA